MSTNSSQGNCCEIPSLSLLMDQFRIAMPLETAIAIISLDCIQALFYPLESGDSLYCRLPLGSGVFHRLVSPQSPQRGLWCWSQWIKDVDSRSARCTFLSSLYRMWPTLSSGPGVRGYLSPTSLQRTRTMWGFLARFQTLFFSPSTKDSKSMLINPRGLATSWRKM